MAEPARTGYMRPLEPGEQVPVEPGYGIIRRTEEGYPYTQAGDIPPPPPGYQLVQPSGPMQAPVPPPPPGYQLVLPEIKVTPDSVPPPPPGYQLVPPSSGFAPPPESPAEPPPPGADMTSWFEKLMSPITRLPQHYMDLEREGRVQMGEGIQQWGEGKKLEGAFNVGVGALGTAMAPINAPIRSFAGQPIEDVTGLPKKYTEFAIGLGLPGVGFAKMPKRVTALFAPETVAPEAMEAAALIRGGTGPAARATETIASELQAFEKPVALLPVPEQLNIMKYIDGSPSAVPPATPQLRALADTLKGGFQARRAELASLPQTQAMNFYDEFFPHFWKDPAAAQAFVAGWKPGAGLGHQGSAASTRGRVYPTIDDGLRAGLEPVFTNPIEAAMHYFTSMDKFIASTKIFNEAVDSGVVRWVHPSARGASGHPQGTNVPGHYVELTGRWAERGDKAKAYAPENWARVYNNWLSRGFETAGGAGEYGPVYNALRTGSNAATQALLSFSGYHAFTMAEASMATQFARVLEAMRSGNVAQAGRELVKVPFAPISYAVQGKKLKDMYLGKTINISPQDREIIDLITDAGGRMAGTRHALDYQASQMGTYLNSFRRGKLAAEFKEYADWVRGKPIRGSARVVASTIGRTMDQWNQPLFQHYIPAMKNGAAHGNLQQWLQANPAATQAEKLAAARRIVDSVDNRFGEMIHDNIFWNKMAKQSAMLGMVSYSWNVGGWREIGGGLRDVARASVGKGEWTPKANYVVSTALTWAMLNGIYQFLKTGEPPKDIQDLMAGRTGGVDAARGGAPERIIPPGIMKDVFAYYEHPVQELGNKVGPFPKLVTQTAMNSDWRGAPVFSPRKGDQTIMQKVPDWLADYFRFVAKSTSIQGQNIAKGPMVGSNISAPEKGLGIRTAPPYLANPERTERRLQRFEQYQWKRKLKFDRRQERLYDEGE